MKEKEICEKEEYIGPSTLKRNPVLRKDWRSENEENLYFLASFLSVFFLRNKGEKEEGNQWMFFYSYPAQDPCEKKK